MAIHSSTIAWKIPWIEEPSKAIVHGVAKESDMTQQLDKNSNNHSLPFYCTLTSKPGLSEGYYARSLTESNGTQSSHFASCLKPLQKLVARDQQCSRSLSAQELGKQYPSKMDWSGPPYSHRRLCRKQDEGEDANSGILFFKRTLLLTKLTQLFLTFLLFWESY